MKQVMVYLLNNQDKKLEKNELLSLLKIKKVLNEP